AGAEDAPVQAHTSQPMPVPSKQLQADRGHEGEIGSRRRLHVSLARTGWEVAGDWSMTVSTRGRRGAGDRF
ncbi:MAG TPA: hypothetical protein PKD12_23815, partial [Nitrospira sp.]|nr:hypothetical protein [Nitrospira sp.]